MKPEKGLQVGLAAFIECPQVKTEYTGQEQEDNNKDIGDGSMEVSIQFTFEYGLDIFIHDWAASPWLE
jgi:hypothetical protein